MEVYTGTTMSASQHIQQAIDNTPPWVNWIVIAGGAVTAWLAPIASLVAIAWGCLQIYGWFEKRRKR